MARPTRWQRWIQHVAASAWGSKVFSWCLHHLDRPLMRATGGRLSVPALLTGLPTVTLVSRGARSGEPRTTPLVGVPIGSDVLLIASNWGGKRHPSWYFNLRANPEATLEFGGRKGPYVAREVTDAEEYRRLWQEASALYIGYDLYRKRVGERQIPLFLLSPAG